MTKADLHLHTDFSDGVLPPPRLAALARAEGLDFFAITDHNVLKASQQVISNVRKEEVVSQYQEAGKTKASFS